MTTQSVESLTRRPGGRTTTTSNGVVSVAPGSTTPLALRPAQAAKALSISARTLWGLTAPRGPIPCPRIGHGKRQTVLYPVAELQAWLAREAEASKGAKDDEPR